MLASGYTETGEEGARRQKELMAAAGSMRILGPNTIGLVNLIENIVLSATGALETDHFPAGAIGVVSQSGGILGALLSRAAARGIGLSKLVSTSNEVDLELSDFIDHLADDDATRVMALYIEAVRNPARFRAAALAGSDRMYDAFFRRLGVIRAQTFGQLLDITSALATGRKLSGRRVAILTSTGGAGTLVSDSLGISGFETPAPDADTAAALRAESVQARPVQSVAVIGAGTMGSGIAISALDAGLDVLLIEAEDSALARGRKRVEDFYAGRVTRGRLHETAATERISRLTTSLDWQRLDSADLVIEAVFEDLGVKQDVLRRLSPVA